MSFYTRAMYSRNNSCHRLHFLFLAKARIHWCSISKNIEMHSQRRCRNKVNLPFLSLITKQNIWVSDKPSRIKLAITLDLDLDKLVPYLINRRQVRSMWTWVMSANQSVHLFTFKICVSQRACKLRKVLWPS